MDKCYFMGERNGIFVQCKALRVGYCPDNCKFRKTEIEFVAAAEKSEKRLRDLGLIPTTDYNKNGDKIMTVKKRGE